MNVLILGGTTEAYALADRLASRAGLRVVTSLAGRTSAPRMAAGETRIGGFGGVEGLAAYLREQDIRAVIDATHPFAATMGWNARDGCRAASVPLLRFERPAWTAEPGDCWEPVEHWGQAVDALEHGGSRRVLLALGRQELAPFAGLDAIWFLIRAVTSPDPMPAFHSAHLLLARGPFSLDDERELLDTHKIDTIVCKNSGGEATAAKLIAARELGIGVIMRQRPARPAVAAATSLDAALAWLDGPTCTSAS